MKLLVYVIVLSTLLPGTVLFALTETQDFTYNKFKTKIEKNASEKNATTTKIISDCANKLGIQTFQVPPLKIYVPDSGVEHYHACRNIEEDCLIKDRMNNKEVTKWIGRDGSSTTYLYSQKEVDLFVEEKKKISSGYKYGFGSAVSGNEYDSALVNTLIDSVKNGKTSANIIFDPTSVDLIRVSLNDSRFKEKYKSEFADSIRSCAKSDAASDGAYDVFNCSVNEIVDLEDKLEQKKRETKRISIKGGQAKKIEALQLEVKQIDSLLNSKEITTIKRELKKRDHGVVRNKLIGEVKESCSFMKDMIDYYYPTDTYIINFKNTTNRKSSGAVAK